MEQMHGTRSRLKRPGRGRKRGYAIQRLMAFVLSLAMVFVNVGNSAAVAMAAEGNTGRVEFQMNREDVWEAAEEAVRAGGGISAESFNFTQGDVEGVQALLAGGRLFEITDGVKYEAYPDTDGAELRVFIRIPGEGDPGSYKLTGKEKLVLMYMNSGEGDLKASVKIVGEETGEVVVRTGEVCVESYQEAFGGNGEEEDGEKLSDGMSQMAPVQGSQNSAGAETEGREEAAVGEESVDGGEKADSEGTAAGEEGVVDKEGDTSEVTDGTEAGTEDGKEEGSDSAEEETLGNAVSGGEEVRKPEQDNSDVSSEVKTEDKTESEVKPGAEAEAEANGDSHDENSAEDAANGDSGEKAEAAEEKEEAKPDHSGSEVKEPEKAGGTEDKDNEADQGSSKEDSGESGKSEEKVKDEGASDNGSSDNSSSDNSADADNSSNTSGNDGSEEVNLSKSENRVRIVAESAEDKDGLVAVGENTTARVTVMELSATGFVAEDAGEDVLAEVPEEVKKFLEAVKELPDNIETGKDFDKVEKDMRKILQMYQKLSEDNQNCSEVNEVLPKLGRLQEQLGNGRPELADVTTKTDNVTKTAYSAYNPNTETSNTVSNGFAQNGYGTVVLNDENPTATDVAFCHYWGSHIAGWPNGFQMIAIEKNTNPGVATATARSSENGLIVEFKKGDVKGTTTIEVGFTVTTLRTTANIASSDQTHADFSGYLYYTVKNDSGSIEPEPTGEGFRTHEIYMPVGSSTFLNIQSPACYVGYYNGWYYDDLFATLIPSNNDLTTSSVDSDIATLNATRIRGSNYTTFKATIKAGSTPGTTIVSAKYNCRVQASGSNYYNNLGFNNVVDDFIVHVYDPETVTIASGETHDFKYPEVAMTGFSGSLLRTIPYVDNTSAFEITKKKPSTPNGTVSTGQMTFTVKAKEENKNAIAGAEAVFAKEMTVDPGGVGEDRQKCDSYTVYVYKVNLKSEEKVAEEKYTVIYTDGVEGKLVFSDQVHEDLKAGDSTPAFESDGNRTEVVTDSEGKKVVQPKREGYTFMGWAPAVAEKVTESVTYVATWQKNERLAITGIEKKLVKKASDVPEDVNITGITYPNSEGKVIMPGDGTSVTLLYKITVTGKSGAAYEVTDTGATRVGGDELKGTIPDSGQVVIYVTKKFNKDDINKEGKLENTATVTPGKNGETTSSSTETTPAEEENQEEENQYKLTYDANGGFFGWDEETGEEVKIRTDTKKTTAGSWEFTISEPSPTREGFTFNGWADASGGAVKYKFNPTETDTNNGITNKITLSKPNTSKTIYAVWKQDSPPPETYTVEYKWSGLPEGAITNPDKPGDKSYPEGQTVTVDTNTYSNVTVTAGEDAGTYEFKGWTVPSEITVNNGKFNMPAKDVTIIGVWERIPESTKTPKLIVDKTNDGFKVDPQTGNATVDYTVKITNKSGFAIYGLRLTDILDKPTVTEVKDKDKGKGSVDFIFSNFQVKEKEGDEVSTNATILSSKKNDDGSITHVLQLLDRNTKFEDEQTVTLTYRIEVNNRNNVAVKVHLHNTAEGASWSQPRTAPFSLFSMFRSASAAADTDDEPDVIGKDDSSASSGETDDKPDVFGKDDSSAGGETGDGDDSKTEGELPEKYTVTYEWSGLPAEADIEEPAQSSYPAKTAIVKVDTEYTKDKKVVVDGKTYTFSGWSTTDAQVKDGKFTMPAQNVTIYGTWTPDNSDESDSKHKVTVHYIYEDGKKAAEDEVRGDLAEGTEYTITSPNIEGYTPDKSVVSGTMGTEDIEVTVVYTKKSSGGGETPETPEPPKPDRETITATWLPGYGDNAPIQTEEYNKGTTKVPAEDYPENPVREGYTFNGWGDPVFDEEGNITITAKWIPTSDIPNPETHKVTVHYIYTDGSKAADDAVRDNLTEGTAYSIASPEIGGYTPDQAVVNGTMGSEDIEITVTYTRNSTGNPDGGSSGGSTGGGGGGGGGSTTTNLSGRVHGTTPTPESGVTVPEDGVPMAETISDEGVPLAPGPVDIPEADVPLAGIPQFDIPDDDVPLASVPRTGDSSGAWHMMALLSAFGLMAMSLLDKRKRHE